MKMDVWMCEWATGDGEDRMDIDGRADEKCNVGA
jgi:hypothetical protein